VNWLNERTETQLRREVAEVVLTVRGYTVFTGRIEKYRWNARERQGTGTAKCNVQLLDYPRAAFECPNVTIGAGIPVGQAVHNLLLVAGQDVDGNQVFSDIDTPVLTGNIGVPLITQRPVDEAQRLCGVDRVWLYAHADGSLKFKTYPRAPYAPKFYRAASECLAFEPDLTTPDYECEKLVVTGSHDVANLADPISPEDRDKLDNAGRTPRTRTVTTAPRGVLFPDQYPGDANETYSEIKTITRTYFGTSDTVIKVVTEIQRPKGVVFPDDYPGDTNPMPAEIITETEYEKIVEKPRGLLLPDQYAGDTDPVVATREKIDQGLPASVVTKIRQPPREPPRITDYDLTTVPVRGEFYLGYPSYSPFMARQRTENVGYLLTQQQANLLAEHLGTIAVQRRDAYVIELPPPDEWLADPSPFCVCAIGDGLFIVDAPELRITKDTMVLSFTGNRIGSITEIPDPPNPPLLEPTGVLQIVPIAALVLPEDLAIASITLTAINGTAPYSWSGTLPTGLSLSSGGVITGTPTTPQSATDYTITVTDATSATDTFDLSIQILALPSPVLPYEITSRVQSALSASAEVRTYRGTKSTVLAITNTITVTNLI
jgi:hypothetical protein